MAKKTIYSVQNWIPYTFLIIGLATSATLFAEEKKKELPKSGTLSSSIMTGDVSRKVPDTWGGIDSSGDSTTPISGSVSRIDKNTWLLKIFNTSADTYSVNLSVIQKNLRGTVVKTDSFSYTLQGGKSDSQKITAGIAATEAALELRSFKNISDKKRKKAKEEYLKESTEDSNSSIPQ